MIPARSLRVIVRRLEHCTDTPDWTVQRAVAAAVDRGRPRAGMDEAEQDAERRRLAGSVRTEEAGDAAVADPERQAVDGCCFAIPLSEIDDLDHSVILRVPAVSHRGARRARTCVSAPA